MPEFKIQRVNYFEGQRLRVKDFEDEQTYHLDMRRRHNKNLHSWGIAEGLRVNREKDTNKVTISPGMALDAEGREIILEEPWVVDNILTLTSAAGGDFILTLAYDDEQVSSANNGLCSAGLTRVAEKAGLFLRAEIGEFIRDGKEVPLAKIIIENCTIKGDPDESVREEVKLGKAVKIAGDTMTGQLRIDLSDAKGAEAQRAHLHLIAKNEEAEPVGSISTNRNSIRFWKSVASDTTAVPPLVELLAGGLRVEKTDTQNTGDDKASNGITLNDASKEWQIFQLSKDAQTGPPRGLIMGDVVTVGNSKKIRPRLMIDTPDLADHHGTVSIGANKAEARYRANLKVFGKDDLTKPVSDRIFSLDVDGIVNAKNYYQNGEILAQSAWENVTNGIAYNKPGKNVGIGTVEPQARLQVSGGAIMPAVGNAENAGIQFPPDPGAGSGDRAFIRYFVEAGESTKLLIGCENDADDRISFQQAGAERLTIYDGNVGVGTTAPQKNLHIQGASSAPFVKDGNDRPGLAITGNYPELDLFSGADNPNHGPTIRLGAYNDAQMQAFKHWVIGIAGRNASFLDIGFSDRNDPNPHAGIRDAVKTILTLLESGNVGIGTLSPSARLVVNDSASAELRVDGNNGTFGLYLGADQNHPWIGTRTNHDLRIFTNATEKVRIQADGNVGLGTAAPAEKLHVAGNLRLNNDRAEIYVNDRNHMIVLRGLQDRTPQNSTSYYQFGGTLAEERGHRFYTGGAAGDQIERLRISNDGIYMAGKIGLGTTAPLANLHLESDRAELRIKNTNANDFAFVSLRGPQTDFWDIALKGNSSNLEFRPNGGDANRVIISPTGQIGIGTQAPSEKLEVAGNLKISNNGHAIITGNVGIGTTGAPLARLHILGVANAASDLLLQSSGGTNLILTSLDATAGETASAKIGARSNSPLHILTNDQARIHISADGKVGVGKIADAAHQLDVQGNVNATGFTVNGSALASSQWQSGTNGIIFPTGNVGIGTTQSPSTRLEVAGDLKVSANGSIGIGTTSAPSARLHILGAANVTSDLLLQSSGGTNLKLASLDAAGGEAASAKIGSQSNSPLHILTSDQSRIHISADGKVGIGKDAAANHQLDVQGNVNATGFTVNGNALASSQWQTSGANDISFSAGNVSIGAAASASEKLKVTGKLNVTEEATLNGNVAVGTATNAANLNVTGTLNIDSTSALNGNVSIGAANKPANLDVTGASTLAVANIGNARAPDPRAIVLTAHGMIESTTGGFKFPDGSIQTTAASLQPITAIPQTAAMAAPTVDRSFGIGTDSPKAKLHVRGEKRRFDALLINDGMSGSKDFLLQKEARLATLQSSEGSLMTFDLENLNVGIGTAKAPTEKLEVAGNIKVEGEALIMEDVTIGTKELPADLEVLGQLFGAAKGPAAEAFRIAVGQTPTPAIWKQEQDRENVVYVDVDSSSGGFTAPPFYFTSLHGDSDHWATVGVTSIHKSTAKGFRVFVHQKGITSERARELNWQVKWLAVGN